MSTSPGETIVREEDGVVYVRTARATCLRRITCCGFIALSVFLFLFPCFILTIIVEGEVVYSTGDRAGEEVRFFQVMEDDTRGFGMSWGSVEQELEDGNYCIKTEVRYLVWEGDGDSLSYCECYTEVGDGEWDVFEFRGSNCEEIAEPEE